VVEAKSRRKAGRYLVPLAIKWQRFERDKGNPNALCAVRRSAREGTLLDVAPDADFVSAMLEKLRACVVVHVGPGQRLEFRSVGNIAIPEKFESIRAVDTEQSNTSVLVGTECVLKLFRRLEPGINPEIELGRFLTETVGFPNTPPLLGTVEWVDGEERSAVSVIHRFIENQGDAWSVTNAYLDRYVEEQRLLTTEPTEETDEQTAYLNRVRQIGRRVAEMQMALASRDDSPEFAPEPITPRDLEIWMERLLQRAGRALDELQRRKPELREKALDAVETLLAQRESLPARVARLISKNVEAVKIRHHGDFHLGQMLMVKDDVFIIDFEGEPRRSLEERRRKAPAARDMAGLLRSIDYSATAALGRALKSAPDEQGKIAQALDDWRERAIKTVLGAYFERLTDPRLWPLERRQADALLDFFLLEKAFYEIDYELAHRPEWLPVPLAGTLRILSRAEEF
jgi:maltose alpha-D-glucosyltransferase/alpha-amylase